jgi:uncharacterized cofD-like protein
MKKIATIGGGTGTFNLLSGLKKYDFDISAIVSMADSGGSNKVIRDEFGILPTSDVRQCLVALANEGNDNSQNLMRKLFMYRFCEGKGIKGMTFGNLFMAALTDILGNQMEAIRKTGNILKIKGRVIPVTNYDSNLIAEYENGLKVVGEHNIDEPKHNGKLKIKKIFLNPPSVANPEAIRAIKKADIIIIGPGDLYTSLMVNLAVDGMAKAIKGTRAKIVYVMNIMTSFGETYGLSALDHIEIVEKYMQGRKLDYIFLNSKKLPDKIIKKYKESNDYPVKDDLEKKDKRVIRSDFLSNEKPKKNKADILQRSLIRHNGKKIARAIEKLNL